MKKPILTVGIVLILFAGGILFISCETIKNSSENSETTEITHKHFQCPMKCEGDKMYDKAGTCPVCKMGLAELE